MNKTGAKTVSCFIVFFIISFYCCLEYDICYKIIVSFLENKEIDTLLVTLIAGLFGFIAAVIPFAIHLLSQNNDFTNKLKQKDNLNTLIKPLFKRLDHFLKYMLFLFSILLIFSFTKDSIFLYFQNKEIFQEYFSCKKFLMSFAFSFYILLIFYFIKYLYMLIRDLKSLVDLFFKSL